MDVTVVHLMPTLMECPLDPAAGHPLRRAIEVRGIRVITEANTKAIHGAKKVEAVVELDNGTMLPADILLTAVGIRPSIEGCGQDSRACATAKSKREPMGFS